MNWFDIFLTTLYLHFCDIQKRSKQIVPWYYTSFAFALTVTMSVTLITDLLFQKRIKSMHVPRNSYLILFLLVGFVVFFAIKRYFFITGRHLRESEKYLELFSEQRRRLFKIFVLGGCCLIPFLLVYLIWYDA
jgi:hypothetical protein